jgi:translation initiation factor IF-1
MPKNTSGGSGHKRQKNKPNGARVRRAADIAKKSDECEVYGRVLKPLGNRRMQVYTQIPGSTEYQTIVCRIRGSLRTRISPDDYVLVQLFDFNTNQGQIAEVYTQSDIEILQRANLWDMTSSRPDESKTPGGSYDDISESEEEDETDASEAEDEPDKAENLDVI